MLAKILIEVLIVDWYNLIHINAIFNEIIISVITFKDFKITQRYSDHFLVIYYLL